MDKSRKKILPSTVALLACAAIAIIFVGFLLVGGGGSNKSSVKALNGTDQREGDIWFSSSKEEIASGEDFEVEIYINTHGKSLGVFAFDFNFDKENLIVDVDGGKDGITKGEDSNNFTMMSNPNDVSDGHFRFSGICAQDCVTGDQKKLATIHMKAKKGFNFSDSSNSLDVKELGDELGKAIVFEKKNGAIIIK